MDNIQILFDDWEIKNKIGSGAFGTVYRIERKEFGVTYTAALKAISIPSNDDELQRLRLDGLDDDSIKTYLRDKVENITKEVELMSKLKGNSNIVSYEDHKVIERTDKIGWDIQIRMELLQPLVDIIKERSLSRRDVIKIGIDMCKALELCHKYQIIHRDIKIENIFLSESGDWKLGDFGIAKQMQNLESHFSRKGTYPYMAPEVYRGSPYDTSVDLYSLGIVLYRLLNHNRSPFMPEYPNPMTYTDREKAFIRRMSGEAITPPAQAKSGRLAEIILMACRYNPQERYSSATQMREDLQAILYTESEGEIIYPSGDSLKVHSNSYISSSKQNTSSNNYVETVLCDQTEIINEETKSQLVKKSILKNKPLKIAVGTFATIGILFVGFVGYSMYKSYISELEYKEKYQQEQQIKDNYISLLQKQDTALQTTGHMAVIKNDGSVWGWGKNSFGEVGNGSTNECILPVQILADAKQISLGKAHTIILKTDGTVWGWGDNSLGQLGNGSTENELAPVKIFENAKSINAGAYHSAIIDNENNLYIAGAYNKSYDENSAKFEKVLEGIKQVALGKYFTVVLKNDGTVWAFGENSYGQIGNGEEYAISKPEQVFSDVKQIAAGDNHVLALKTDGTIWAWGLGENGQLGTGNTSNQLTPVKIADSASIICAKANQSAYINANGDLFVWGNGVLLPTKKMEGATQVALTANIMAATRLDGSLFIFGDNKMFEIGIENVQTQNEPTKILDKVNMLPDTVSAVKFEEKWVVEGYETAEPYKEYEVLYRNGVKTDEIRYTGNVKPQEPVSNNTTNKTTTTYTKPSTSYKPSSSGNNNTSSNTSNNETYTQPTTNENTTSNNTTNTTTNDTGAPDIYLGFD